MSRWGSVRKVKNTIGMSRWFVEEKARKKGKLKGKDGKWMSCQDKAMMTAEEEWEAYQEKYGAEHYQMGKEFERLMDRDE